MGLLYRYSPTNFTICVVLFVGAGIIFFAGLIIILVLLHKKGQKLVIILTILALFVPTFYTGITYYGNLHSKYESEAYEDAIELYSKNSYAAARKLFELIPDYFDSARLARECSHNSARYYIGQGRYVDAMGQLHRYADDSEGKSLFKAAEDALVALNASGEFGAVLDAPGKWEAESERYYLSITKKNGVLYYETNIVQSPYEPLFKYKFHIESGILKANLGKGSVAVFQCDDNNHAIGYFYENGKVVKFVRQKDN